LLTQYLNADYFSPYYITLENNIMISIYNHVKNSEINILHWNIYFNIRLSNILTWVFTPIYFMYIFQCSHLSADMSKFNIYSDRI